MKSKSIKRFAVGITGFLILMILFVFALSWFRLSQDYENLEVKITSIPIPTEDAALSRGKHIAATRYCGSCHGENLAGDYLINEPVMAVVPAPNLTAGGGGIGGINTDEDWIRAIRHGVGHNGRGLIGMPSRIWHQMSDEDLGALIAYLKTIPAVDNELPARRFGPMFRLLLALGQAPPSEAAVIDHDAPNTTSISPGITLEYGEYLAAGCTACHGEALNGGIIRDLQGELVTAPNLTPGGELAGWSVEDFFTAMRTGITPGGGVLADTMPWPYLGQMTDDELKAIWMYLQSTTALEQGTERTDL